MSQTTNELLERLRAVGGIADRVDADAALTLLRTLADLQLSLAELSRVTEFAEDQFTRRYVDWMFSPAATPDDAAHQQADKWLRISEDLRARITAEVPAYADASKRRQDLVSLNLAMQRRVNYDASRPFPRAAAFQSSALSKFGIALNKIGCGNIGRSLYRCALYPPRTTGRVSG